MGKNGNIKIGIYMVDNYFENIKNMRVKSFGFSLAIYCNKKQA